MSLLETWQDVGNMEKTSTRIKAILDGGDRERAIEELRTLVTDKCTLFGATTLEEGRKYHEAGAQKAAAIFAELQRIGELDEDFLVAVVNRYGTRQAPQNSGRRRKDLSPCKQAKISKMTRNGSKPAYGRFFA